MSDSQIRDFFKKHGRTRVYAERYIWYFAGENPPWTQFFGNLVFVGGYGFGVSESYNLGVNDHDELIFQTIILLCNNHDDSITIEGSMCRNDRKHSNSS